MIHSSAHVLGNFSTSSACFATLFLSYVASSQLSAAFQLDQSIGLRLSEFASGILSFI
jgi:hypothetical protein